jgi:Tol biopolymer transport system component
MADASDDRLDSWKEIAAYLKRDVKTAQRWEKREGMPVHRHVHDRMGSVYAFRAELDEWARTRRPSVLDDADAEAQPVPALADPSRRERRRWPMAAMAAVLLAIAVVTWIALRREGGAENPLADARYVPLTEFDGIEQAAAVSRDGKFVAFLSDHDGQMDVWVTQVGVGQFYNLTHGRVQELVNPSVRTLGFSPDASLVTFWARMPGGSSQSPIGIWAVPVLGGQPRPYVEGAAEFDWSGDGGRLVYHTPGAGDPMYVRDAGPRSDARAILSAPPGLHSHFPVWSPDQAFIYFVQGAVPDRMDIWRIRPTGDAPERITHHNSLVTHPVFLSARTLLYLASDADGSGPWIYSLDVDRRIPRRVSSGIDKYTSLAASANGRRLVVTLASPKGTLWRLPIAGAPARVTDALRIPLTTGSGSSPRLGAGFLVYVSSKGTGESVWKLQGDTATELWSAPDARIIGGPAISRDQRRVAFAVQQNGQAALMVVNADGTATQVVTTSLELQGSPAWTTGRAFAHRRRRREWSAAAVHRSRRRRRPEAVRRPARGRSRVVAGWRHRGVLGADIGTTFPIAGGHERRRGARPAHADVDPRRQTSHVHAGTAVARGAARGDRAQEPLVDRSGDRRRAAIDGPRSRLRGSRLRHRPGRA